jgi:hypothetical protein
MSFSKHINLSFRRRLWLVAFLSLAGLVALTLLLPAGVYLSSPRWDLGEFAALRGYVAESLRAGHFPLWNPYIYSGEPLLGDFQSGELYPPNVIFLVLPLVRAMNLSFLLHLWFVGWGVGVWAGRRGYHPWAATLAGLTAALSGPVFLRLANGQLAYLIGIAWTPWILCGLEAAWRGPARKPLLWTMAAVALQISGGHPQYVFYGAIAAGLHAIAQSIIDPAVRRRALPMVALAYVGGALLAAALLLPGLAAMGESVRQGRLDYDFVRTSAFPPENFLTLIAPGFFGNFTALEYWGRYFYWEMCLFFGVAGLALAVLALGDKVHRRTARAEACLVVVFVVLALGEHTPLLRFLYDYVPYFDKFRSLSKFSYPAMLFAVMALAAGADAVLRGRVGAKLLSVGLMVVGLVAGGAGICLLLQPAGLNGMLALVQHSNESLALNALFADPQFATHAARQAGRSLAWGGLILALCGAAWLLARRWPGWRFVPLAVLPVEMLCFAHANLLTVPADYLRFAPMKNFIAAHPGDYRIINPAGLNAGYFLGVSDLWGDNPSAMKRYAEFLAFSQGQNPDRANQMVGSNNLSPMLALLRLRYAFAIVNQDIQAVEYHNTLPHALLFADYQVCPGRDAIFAEFAKPDFDPYQTVFLETEPVPKPEPAATPGTVKVAEINGDKLEIEADTAKPAILLITDVYSRDWYARPLAGSIQTHYDILPGDYILRAIPLEAGHHHLAVEYNPPSFHKGLWISAVAWVVWLAAYLAGGRQRVTLTDGMAAAE